MENINSKIIDALGGTKKVSELIGVTPSAVSIWRKKGIPRDTLRYLKLKKPKVFKDLISV